MSFQQDFLWGVAAAAIQIEGGANLSQRGASVWDAFCQQPGQVMRGDTTATACDHFHRYPEDVALIADLGAKAYRLSISWPRVLPDGEGRINDAGLDFYDRVIDALLARGIQPWVTLFHWDYPLALYRRGGWMNRQTVDWFARFAGIVAERLGDRVQHWMTLNEPQVFLGLGHGEGRHAPGVQLPIDDFLLATHHALCAHGAAVKTIREYAKLKPIVGWAPHAAVPFPATNEPQDIAAARQVMFDMPDHDCWYFSSGWFADPVILGQYPESGLSRFGQHMPANFERDLPDIQQPLEFYGVNIYQGTPIKADENGQPIELPHPAGHPINMHHWPIDPCVLYWGPRFLHERYKLPLYITENGTASMDWVHTDGRIHDTPRIDYLTRHLVELRRAMQDGVDIRGYFQWSFMDNFEWAEGYRMRFGLIYVDYKTLERIPKDSYMWYQQVILSNGECLPETVAALR